MKPSQAELLAGAIDRLLTWQQRQLELKEEHRKEGFRAAYRRRRWKPPAQVQNDPINEPGPDSPAINSSPQLRIDWFSGPRRK